MAPQRLGIFALVTYYIISVYYDKICIQFASHHLLLYVVYMCQKSLNFTYAFKCYQQNVSGFTLAGPPCRPGLVAMYDIRPGNGAGQFLQTRSPHGARNYWPDVALRQHWCTGSNILIFLSSPCCWLCWTASPGRRSPSQRWPDQFPG